MVEDSTRPAVREGLHAELSALADWVQQTTELDLATAEQRVRRGGRLRGPPAEAGADAGGLDRAAPRR